MVDRLEELLAQLEDEDDEEEREDMPAVTAQAALPGPRDRETEEEPEGRMERAAPAEGGETGTAGAGEDGGPVYGPEEVWPAQAAAGLGGPAAPGGGGPEPEAGKGPGWDAAAEPDRAPGHPMPEERGLEELYRQAVRAGRSAEQAIAPVEQAGRRARAQEPGSTAALTVEELDRAVRRDSWRYDGGMTLY